jgi:ankyrin repeat protein
MINFLFFFYLTACTSLLYPSQIDKAIEQQHKNILTKNPQQTLWSENKTIPIKYSTKRPPKRSVLTRPTFFHQRIPILPLEIQNLILHCATHNPPAKTISKASSVIRALLCLNTHFNKTIDNAQFSDNLIKALSLRYRCSHETIACNLRTQQSLSRLNLQYELKDLCSSTEDNNLLPILQQLVSDGANLEFTYNHEHQQKTPLMISMSYEDNNMFGYLLEQGAYINGHNSNGITALHLALGKVINENHCMQLITHPNIAINQQNNRGETPLLYFLMHREGPIKPSIIVILKELLKTGSNARLANRYGLNPVNAAKKLKIRIINNTIRRAIKAQTRAIKDQ